MSDNMYLQDVPHIVDVTCRLGIALKRNYCPSLSMKEVIELDSVIDVELVIGRLH